MDQKVGASPGHFSWPRVLIGRHPRHTLLRLVLLVLASIGLFGYLLLPIRTQGISMLSTYELGSLKLVNAMAYTRRSPERGDVVAIRLAGRRVVYIKRVIGLPSERVRIDAGVVYTDEVALDEPYVRRRAAWTVESVALAADEYFVIGDNRGMPTEQHEFGTVARERIVGKALF